jgi:hypothetical protein
MVRAQFTIDVSHAPNNCVHFVFPRWTIEGIWDLSGSGQLEFRTTGDSPTEYLVAVRLETHETGRLGFRFSTQKYLISLKRPDAIHPVPDEVWEEAEIVNRFPRATSGSAAYEYGQTLDPKGFRFGAKLVKLRGKHWAGRARFHAIHSPSKRYVVLQSMNGRLLFDGEVYGGKAFAQVFDTRTAQEIFWLEGKWKERGSSVVFGNTEWLRDDLLAVSFDPYLRRGVALCKVP